MLVLKRLCTEEKGQGLAEYGLIITLVALAVFAALGAVGGQLQIIYSGINEKLGP